MCKYFSRLAKLADTMQHSKATHPLSSTVKWAKILNCFEHRNRQTDKQRKKANKLHSFVIFRPTGNKSTSFIQQITSTGQTIKPNSHMLLLSMGITYQPYMNQRKKQNKIIRKEQKKVSQWSKDFIATWDSLRKPGKDICAYTSHEVYVTNFIQVWDTV